MKIMVGYDRPNVAKDALELADQHANVFDAKVYVLTSLAQSRELQLEDIQYSGAAKVTSCHLTITHSGYH